MTYGIFQKVRWSSKLKYYVYLPYVHHKGLKKRLLKLSKYKDCKLIAKWMKSIINHLYWRAASADGDSEQIIVDGSHLLTIWLMTTAIATILT